eukprot:superscaffoldBa00001949_g12627
MEPAPSDTQEPQSSRPHRDHRPPKHLASYNVEYLPSQQPAATDSRFQVEQTSQTKAAMEKALSSVQAAMLEERIKHSGGYKASLWFNTSMATYPNYSSPSTEFGTCSQHSSRSASICLNYYVASCSVCSCCCVPCFSPGDTTPNLSTYIAWCHVASSWAQSYAEPNIFGYNAAFRSRYRATTARLWRHYATLCWGASLLTHCWISHGPHSTYCYSRLSSAPLGISNNGDPNWFLLWHPQASTPSL